MPRKKAAATRRSSRKKTKAETPPEESAQETKKQKTEKEENREAPIAGGDAISTTTTAAPKVKTDSLGELKDPETGSEMLEKGHIYFFYRPTVGEEEVHGFQEVQRLYIVLVPQGHIWHKGESTAHGEKRTKKRIIVVPKKKLPSTGGHERFWAFVEKVSESVDEVHQELDEKDYETKTRGFRFVAGARPCGEGVYAIVMHKGHSHLAYVLEIPQDIGEVQEAFNIQKEGSFVLAVKNPEAKHPSIRTFRTEADKPDYPEHLKKEFNNYQWISAKPVELLDYEKTQLLLIGASHDVAKEFGEVGQLLERMEKLEEKQLTDDKLFKELHMSKKEHPPQPLHGEWK